MLPQVEETPLLYPRRCPVELRVLWSALADWMWENSEAEHPQVTWWLEGLLPFDQKQSLELVWLEGKRCFPAFSARRKHQSLLSWVLLPRSEHSRLGIQWEPLPLGHPQSQPHRRRSHAGRPHPLPFQPLLWPIMLQLWLFLPDPWAFEFSPIVSSKLPLALWKRPAGHWLRVSASFGFQLVSQHPPGSSLHFFFRSALLFSAIAKVCTIVALLFLSSSNCW